MTGCLDQRNAAVLRSKLSIHLSFLKELYNLLMRGNHAVVYTIYPLKRVRRKNLPKKHFSTHFQNVSELGQSDNEK